jgi:hypothetical protein
LKEKITDFSPLAGSANLSGYARILPMKMRAWIIVIPLLGAAFVRAQDDLPKHAAGELPGFEPKLTLDGPNAAPGAPGAPVESSKSVEERVKELQAVFVRAEQHAAGSEQLYKEGILAKVEVEQRMLGVVKARKDLADATLAVAAEQAEAVKKSFDSHGAGQAELDAANAALKAARDEDATATADWEKGQLDAAAIDLKRKRKLYAEGVGSRREVEMAEDRLALLSGTGAKPGEEGER